MSRRLGLLLLLMLGAAGEAVAQTNNEESICRTDPNVFFCDNFEDRALGAVFNDAGPRYKNGGYGSNPGTPDIVNTEHFDGTKSLRMVTPGNNVDCCASGGAIDSNFLGGDRRTVYWRWYSKYSTNYFWSPIGTKHNEMYTCCFSGQHGLGGSVQDNGHFNYNSNHGPLNTPLIVYLFARGATITPGDTDFTQNQNGTFRPSVGVWNCYETRVTMNTGATSNDGYIQGWIDDVPHWEYPNVRVVDIPNPVSRGFFMASYWNCDGDERCGAPGTNPHYPNDTNDYRHPTMYRYMDNLIGSTARIGCLNQAPPTPPAAPSNLIVHGVFLLALALGMRALAMTRHM